MLYCKRNRKGNPMQTKQIKEVANMFTYEDLKDFENNGELAVTPLSYVVLGCAR